MTFDEFVKIANVLTPGVIAVLGFLLRQTLGRITDRIDRIETDSQAQRVDLERLRNDAVRREDWLRDQVRVGQKLDEVMVNLARLNATIDVGRTVSAAVEALAESIRNDRERSSGHDA